MVNNGDSGRKRVALVTGGGQGVGRRVALDLSSTGVADVVVVNDVRPEAAQAVADEVAAVGGHAVAAPFDVTDFDAVMSAFSAATDSFGGVDILVNNAGNSGTAGLTKDAAKFWETQPADWRPWLEVNLFGVLNCTRAALPGMVERRYGRVVTVISDAARVGEPDLVVYSGAKAGAAGFTRAVGRAVGRYGITANCVALGATNTPTVNMLADLDEETSRKLLTKYAIKRFGEPEDGAAAIVFLAAESAGWVTTQTLPVNGGYSSAL
jgi:NAD(P)-dependent dehydrogenase (short-subunit alcohol dehydrogenase family)